VYATRVADPRLFVNTAVGSMGSYTTDSIEGYLRDLIVARLNDVLGETLRTIFDLPRQYDELAEVLKGRVRDDFGKYGLELADFFISSITPPEDVQKAIDERAGMGAIGQGNLGSYMQFKAGRALGDAAASGGAEGGGGAGSAAAAGMGLGVGAGLGMMVPGMIRDAAQGAPGGAAGVGRCGACGKETPSQGRFCMHCGAPAAAPRCGGCGGALPSGAKFCPGCGAKA
jgi:membrane protease subunit (stomatin/prohibitin family)